MKNKLIIVIVFLVIMSTSFFLGGKYYSNNNIVYQTSSDTTHVTDSVIHVMKDSAAYYVEIFDTIIEYVNVPIDIDTAYIMKDYYAKKKFIRNWEDSLIKVSLTDILYENSPYSNKFTYIIKRPQQIIVNNYTKPLYKYTVYGGLFMDIGVKEPIIGLNLTYIKDKNLFSIGYAPHNKYIHLKYNTKIFQR